MAAWLQVAVPRSRLPLKVQNLRVNNVEIPNSKKIEISLQYIYGIGSTTAKAILRDTVSSAAAAAAAAAAQLIT
jgi:small subunit ribosomal protein S13